MKYFRLLKNLDTAIYSVVITIAIIGLTGWISGELSFASVSSLYIPIAPATSLAFVFLSLMSILLKTKTKQIVTLFQITSFIFFIFFINVVFAQTLKLPWDIESLIVTAPDSLGKVKTGRMSPITAILFIIEYLTLILLYSAKKKITNNIIWISIIISFYVSTILLIGYLYNQPLLYGGTIIPVALPTAICFWLISISQLYFVSTKIISFPLLTVTPTTKKLITAFLPVIIGFVFIVGFMQAKGYHLFNPVLNSALMLSILIPVTVLITFHISRSLGNSLEKANNSLIRTKNELTKVQEITQVGSWYLDIANNEVTWTEEVYKMYGFDPALPVPPYTEHMKLFTKESWELLSKSLANTAETGIAYELELKTVRKDKSNGWMWVRGETASDAEGKIIGLWGAARDITDKKNAENELKKIESIQQKMLSNIGDVIVIIDKNEINRYKSPNVKNLFGWEVDELVGKSAWDKVYPDDVESAKKVLAELAYEPKKSTTTEVRYLRKDGEYRWIEITISNLLNAPEINGFLGNYHDITERKLADEALRSSQEMLVSSQSLANICSYSTNLVVTDIDKSQWVCSPELYKICGIDETYPHTIEGWIGLLHPDYREEVAAHHESVVFEKKSFNREYKIIRINDGVERWVHGTGELVYDKNGNPIRMYGAIQDITEHKLAELELKAKNEELLKAEEQANSSLQQIEIIQANTPNIIWKWDIDKEEDFKNSYISEVADEFLALPKGSIGNSMPKFFSYILSEYLPLVDDAIKNAIKNPNTLISIEYEVKKADGKLGWFSSAGKVIPDNEKLTIYGSTIDITEKKQNEKKLVLSDTVFNLTLDMFCIAGFDGYFKYLNPAWERTLGWSIEELLSKPWLDFVHPDDAKDTENIKSVIVDGKEIYKFENRYICKDGSIKWLAWNSQPFPKENIMIGAVRDITETKKTENELIKSKEKAEESDKLKSAFLANMSHEIRTPMNGILGFTSLLQEANLSVENQKNYISIIEKSGDRLLNTVNDIIEISKIESGDINVTKSEVDLIKHLDTQVSFFKPEAEKKNIDIVIQNNIDGNDLKILTDKNKLSSILSNLIKNAIKYTNEGTINVGFKIENDQILFSCQDTGIGIPRNRQEAIFNRFEQADIEDKHAHQGSGLGLAIVKSYVEILDGKIWLESEEGIGSIFYVSLPFEHEKKEEQLIPQEVKSYDSGIKNINVLVAEDDESSVIYLSVILKGKVKNISIAENGFEAVETLKNDSSIDLVLMDIRMPVMSGNEATKQIRKFNKDVVIIAQTAFTFEEDKRKALDAGCNDYISKPINKDKLFELINKYF